MSVELRTDRADGVVEVTLSGKLEAADYETFRPRVEALIRERGKLRLLCRLTDFHGWTAGGLWEDVKFDAHHFRDVERLALVGDSRWEAGMAAFCQPFTSAAVRYFDVSKAADAERWVAGKDATAAH